ncbi:cyclic nucleotide-binding domain-containing protein [Caenimonas sedimenti]|uniref:Cyclic nucleotide-binding domain-containing protein n=1 Tax=Caenimonas sedimenti TaxID=2596921 RepID=A0A562ZXR4_9BURK|nr:cyclic nucleotide-binding and patatin-like phospholipase domain-containing protein [Caenimonas sedimenti]TWO73410.1 cyclic nucleotide-binding domain-containing protein [Caenimonas sedimenti]
MQLPPPADWIAGTALLQGAPEAVIADCAARAGRREFAAGDVLIRAGTRTASICFVLAGTVEVRLPGSAAADAAIAQLGEGKVLGEIQAVTGHVATADVVAVTAGALLEIDLALRRDIALGFPAFDERLVWLATRNLRTTVFQGAVRDLLRGCDPLLVEELGAGAAEVVLERGEELFAQGEEADAWYILTSGRLAVVTSTDDGSRKIAELMPGASVGEMAIIAGEARTATVKAERKATLMRISRAMFDRFADQHPRFARNVMSAVVRRLAGKAPSLRVAARVLVVLRISGHPMLDEAFRQLCASLQGAGGAAIRTRTDFESAVGYRIDPQAAESHPVWMPFDVWLEEAQSAHSLVVVDGGNADDAWRRECLLQADHCVWLVEPVAQGLADPPPEAMAALDAARRWAKDDTQRLPWSLVIAHPAATKAPRNTRAWLRGAEFDRHFHLRVHDVTTSDRAARLLAGRGTGLALSGGGARGLAHVGVLKACAELGIAIDWIGGTSFGAIQAGMFAMGLSTDEMRTLNLEVIAQRPFQEYTLPIVAMVASRRRDASIHHSFGETQIEDLWIPYLAVSTDLCSAQAVVHESGSLGLAVSASSSIPGVLVPVLDGERILVDGGILNNLPSDLVKHRAGGRVIAVKVAPDDELVAPEGGFAPAWKFVLRRLVPGMKPLRSPRLADLILRTLTVSSASRMAQVTREADLLIEPDVASFGMLQFHKIDELIERGYRAGLAALRGWSERR